MKSIKIIIGLVIFTTLLSSCGSLSISQKRYSRGLNIDLFSSKDEKPIEFKAAKAEKNQVAVAKKVESNTTSNENLSIDETISEIKENKIETKEQIELIIKKDNAKQLFDNIKTKDFKSKNQNKINSELKSFIPESTQEKNDSGVSTLLLILIALIIPPLAVFLYFDEINFHFWLNLILLLVAGGVFLSGGLLFYVGAAFIHALLVIFGLFG